MKRKKKPYFKINSSTIILLTAFLIGLGIVLYPSVSDYINARHQTRAIAGYREAVEDLTEEDYARLRQEADDFNRELEEAGSILTLTDAQEEEYYSLLDPAGTGMMGYLEIESIDVYLPVYHGTEDTVLQVGAGHVEGSSLPVGGEGTHCVLSGHRGLPSSILLSELDQMEEGDVFLLHVLDETLAYEVDQIRIVLPDEVGDLAILPGEDLCTLVTCTPYGVNTHRLLVRGHRVEYTEKTMEYGQADAELIDPLIVASVLAVPVFVILLAVLLTEPLWRKKRRKRGK